MSKDRAPRRLAQQWFSLQHLAWLLDFDVSTVRRWWREGRFGPPRGEERSDYWFALGNGHGADVRVSSRGYTFFLESQEVGLSPHSAVTARTEGEARRVLNGV